MNTKDTKRRAQRMLAAAFSLFLVVAGCSSGTKKVDFPQATDPTAAANQLDSDIARGLANHYDVLANSEFTDAQKGLEKAKREIAEKDKPEKVLDTLGYARANLDKAREHAEGLKGQAEGILEARSSALSASVRDFPDLSTDLKKYDDDLRAEISNLEKGRTTSERWAALQKDYMSLELRALQDAKLNDAKAKVRAAINNGAEKNTPNMLKQTQRDLINAENVIAANRHDEGAIEPAVTKANASAELLTDILAATKRPEGTINEDAAKALVMQGRKLNDLGQKLEESTSDAASKGRELADSHDKLKADNAALSLDHALEKARKDFTADEAEVYRQGDKILIRLKAVGFRSGRAELPEKSIPLLAKVKTIAEELHPQQIVVEGHTDSIGKSQTNKVLSQNRAEAVATYFSSNGLDKDKIFAIGRGYEKPIVTNKTKQGRAQNRRVDVIIVPSSGGESSTSSM